MTLYSSDLYSNLDSAASLLERSQHRSEALPFLRMLADNTPWKSVYRLRMARASSELSRAGDERAASSALSTLSEMAASSTTVYALRAEAAADLHGPIGAHDLHSGELTLLASGKRILPDQADKPYYFPVRLAAATTATPEQRPAILRKAIAITPQDTLRLRLFRAEFALSHNELAFTAILPLLQSPDGYVTETASLPEDDSSTGSVLAPAEETTSEEAGGQDGAGDNTPVPLLLKSTREKVDFALMVATLYENNDQDQQALDYARLASRLNHERSRRPEIDHRMAELTQRLRVEMQNSERRPAVHDALEQIVIVRPKVSTATIAQVQP